MKQPIVVTSFLLTWLLAAPAVPGSGQLAAQDAQDPSPVLGKIPVSPWGVVHPFATRHGEIHVPERGTVQYPVNPATQDPSVLVTLQTLKKWETELSNWGRWGPNDQIGALNLITPEKTKQAADLVKEGISVSLAHFAEWEPSLDSWRFAPAERWHSGTGLDAISFHLHDGTVSHLDAICHYSGTKESPSVMDGTKESVIYNGYPFVVDAEDGCDNMAIDRMGVGYVTRGILVDIPLMRGVDYLEPSTPIFVKDLEDWEKFAGVKVQPGDVLLVRGGRWALREEIGPWDYARGGAGLHASVLPWLRERGVAMIVGDAVNDVQPSGVEGINRPVHQMSMVVMGLPTVDNGYLEDAARVARDLKRWEFMLSWQIWQVPGGTSSPFNAVATF